ncbi:hypothetical protein QN379_03285 [Glaciimonas sp. Gout2]|uniref:hypothetical protein n=1 Tax=Glaciimonas sp. Cout2 TaxID=3048621 RepID=UPI002B2237B5|nr:hypothetical protein [Glaciimonas sp. Cout2]MEB0011388.1 hypothetical protein [Glaciimonas sp. Cout2]MEB0081038.1 hypothetical protein [Glaciimonas sp. Gout2]
MDKNHLIVASCHGAVILSNYYAALPAFYSHYRGWRSGNIPAPIQKPAVSSGLFHVWQSDDGWEDGNHFSLNNVNALQHSGQAGQLSEVVKISELPTSEIIKKS